MSRLIDADKLKKVLINNLYGDRISKGLWVPEYAPSDEYIRGYNISINNAVQSISELITEAPTVDAVEVVRCKDCKYGKKNNDVYYSLYRCAYTDFDDYNNAEHFCSDGERKVDNEK